MSKLEKLTEEQEALMHATREEWIRLAFDKCQLGIDKSKFESGIEWLYRRFLNLEMPTVVYCDSIEDALRKITLVKDFGLELDSPVPTTEEFKSKMQENLSLKSTYIGWSNFGWVSFYNYFTKIGVLNNEDFNNYAELIKSNVFECFEFEYAVFAVQPPKYVRYNDEMIANSVDGPSVEFNDGCKLYSINGLSISEELFMRLKNEEFTIMDFLQEDNEEIKSACISFIQQTKGDVGIIDFFKDNLKEIDTFTDVKDPKYMEGTLKTMNVGVYSLFKGQVNDIDIAYVRCYCPSTDRMFFLGVEPTHTNAKDAIASLYQVPVGLEDKIVSISRQGEKFSTTFDEQTMSRIASGELKPTEYTSISGDRYFNLMTYEY